MTCQTNLYIIYHDTQLNETNIKSMEIVPALCQSLPRKQLTLWGNFNLYDRFYFLKAILVFHIHSTGRK